MTAKLSTTVSQIHTVVPNEEGRQLILRFLEFMRKSGDEGIDGIIKEDLLGLDAIYLQAKKWEGTIGRPEIQKFAGALQGQRAKKGIFITTGKFSNEALEYTKNIDAKIVLIDGNQLAEYMIEHNIGVSDVKNYVLKNINSDYFEEDV